jgi:threonine synthase
LCSGDGKMSFQECISCHEKYGVDEIVYFCKKCGDILEIKIDLKKVALTVKAGK